MGEWVTTSQPQVAWYSREMSLIASSLLTSLLTLSPALAQDAPPPDEGAPPPEQGEPQEGEPTDDGSFPISRPFVLTIVDPERQMSSAPTALLCKGAISLPLKDDGAQPDVDEGDLIYAGVTQTCDDDQMDIQLMIDDESFFDIEVELPSDAYSPSVMITFAGEEVLVEVRSDDPNKANGAGQPGGQPGPGGQPADGGPPTGGGPAPDGGGLPPIDNTARRAATASDDGASWWVILGALLLGGAGGYGVAQLIAGAAGRRGLSRVGQPRAPETALARLSAQHPRAVWVVPDAAARASLVRALASLSSERLVLLAPLSDGRTEHAQALRGLPGVFWIGDERAELDRLVTKARRLSDGRWQVAVVVEGEGALEAPLKGEAPDAVVQDLIGDDKLDRVVAVVTADLALSEPAAVTLTRGEGGLYHGEQRILTASGEPAGDGPEAREE